jgi:hypothetical protein
MQRIVKRFLLHQQRNEIYDFNNITEVKQDLQAIRYEVLNDIQKSHNETKDALDNLHKGLEIIGEFMLKTAANGVSKQTIQQFKDYKSFNQMETNTNKDTSINNEDHFDKRDQQE